MIFNYGHVKDVETEVPTPEPADAQYRYYVAYRPPKIEIIKEPYRPTQPFDNQDSLVNRMFGGSESGESDLLRFPAERAQLQHRQLELLLEQLAARHAINYQIRKDIEYQECRVGARLDELQERPLGLGREGRFETELIKQMQHLQKDRHAEHVACWRDTSRILSDLCECWTEYADQSRKSRLIDDGF